MARNVVPNTGVETIGTPDKRWSAIYADHVYTDDYVNVKQFGAKGDGVTDDTEAIQAAVSSHPSTLYFPDGDYLISSTIEHSTEYPIDFILGCRARIFTETDGLEYLIRLGRWGTAKWQGRFIGGILDANNKAQSCLGVSSYDYFMCQNVWFKNFKLYGLHTNPNNIPSYWFQGYNLYFRNSQEIAGSQAIRCGNVDNFFNNIMIENVQKGMYLRDKTMVTDMHHWLNASPTEDFQKGSCMVEIDNTADATLGFGSIFTRCYADTLCCAFKIIPTRNETNSRVDLWTRDCFLSLAKNSPVVFNLENNARLTDIGSFIYCPDVDNAHVVYSSTGYDYVNTRFLNTNYSGVADNAFYNSWVRTGAGHSDDANASIYTGNYFVLPGASNVPRSTNAMLEVVRNTQNWNNNQAYVLQKLYTLETDQTIALWVRWGNGYNNSITFKKWTRIAS